MSESPENENAGNSGGFKISPGWWLFIIVDLVVAAVLLWYKFGSVTPATTEQATAPQISRGVGKQPSAVAIPKISRGAEEQLGAVSEPVALEPRSTLDSGRLEPLAKPASTPIQVEWLEVKVNLCQDNRPGFDKCPEVPAQALVGYGYYWYCVSDENLPPDQRIDYMRAGDTRYENLTSKRGFTCGGGQRSP